MHTTVETREIGQKAPPTWFTQHERIKQSHFNVGMAVEPSEHSIGICGVIIIQ